jgi:hypothetical protein
LSCFHRNAGLPVAFSLDSVHPVIHDHSQGFAEGTNPYRHLTATRGGILLMGLWLGETGALAQTTTLEVTSATLEKAGVVTVSVDVMWGGNFVEAFLDIDMVQPVGRTKSVEGDSFEDIAFSCTTGETVSLTTQVFPFRGRFGPGTAFISPIVFVEDPCCSAEADDTTTVRLRRTK